MKETFNHVTFGFYFLEYVFNIGIRQSVTGQAQCRLAEDNRLFKGPIAQVCWAQKR